MGDSVGGVKNVLGGEHPPPVGGVDNSLAARALMTSASEGLRSGTPQRDPGAGPLVRGQS